MIPRQVFSQGQVLWHVLRVGEEFFESKMLNLLYLSNKDKSHIASLLTPQTKLLNWRNTEPGK